MDMERAGFVLAGGPSFRVGRDKAPAGFDPLCAVYHCSCLGKAGASLDCKILKMHDFISTLQVLPYPVPNTAAPQNSNTPDQWTHR